MAVSINQYNKMAEYGWTVMDLSSDTLTLALMSVSHTFTPTNTAWANVSANEITADGYTSPGQNLTTVTWLESSGVVTLDAANVSWTAGASGITATDAVLYNNSTTVPVDALMYSIDFGASETANNGTDFNVNWHTSGIFTT